MFHRYIYVYMTLYNIHLVDIFQYHIISLFPNNSLTSIPWWISANTVHDESELLCEDSILLRNYFVSNVVP